MMRQTRTSHLLRVRGRRRSRRPDRSAIEGFQLRPSPPSRASRFSTRRCGQEWPFPTNVRPGTCGTCKARRIAGVIVGDWAQAPGNAYLRADRDEVLLCQTRALSNCSFEIPGSVNLASDRAGSAILRSRACGAHRSLSRLDTIELLLELDPPLEFDAGQFAVLRAPHIAGFRGYSMVNHPGSSPQAKFIVKQKPAAPSRSGCLSDARPGDPVEWFGPLGKAIFTPQEQRTIAVHRRRLRA